MIEICGYPRRVHRSFVLNPNVSELPCDRRSRWWIVNIVGPQAIVTSPLYWPAKRINIPDDPKQIGLLAAAPLLSATTLARILGIAVKNAIRILDDLATAEIAIEVTHRARRRLFGLRGLVPLRDVVQPPYRPEPGRGRGRPPILRFDDDVGDPPPLPPFTPIERRALDYTALEETMAHLVAVVRASRVALRSIADGIHGARANAPPNDAEAAPAC